MGVAMYDTYVKVLCKKNKEKIAADISVSYGKGKIHQASHHKEVWGSGSIVPSFLSLTLDGGEWLASHPGRFASEERSPSTHGIVVWLGPRANMDAMEKKITYFRRESNPGSSVIQSVA
jgi:hypothetical protein